MLGALAAVLALIFAAAWVLKRIQHGQASGRQHLKVVSILPLSTRERVVLIQAGEEQVLMGVSGAGIQHLHTLEKPIVPAPAEGRESASGAFPGPGPSFAGLLKAMTGRRGT